jgi:pimeloyl-ACP methyl ester carboxylesterase
MRFVLVHSPLVGPTTWRWVADVLTSAGHDVAVPDLREAAMSGEPQSVIAAVRAAAGTGPATVVGHSGAGHFLPWVAEHLESPPGGIVFVDAGIPPCEGRATPSADFLDRLRSLAAGDMLPRWSTWWGTDVMEMLVLDGGRRAEIEAEMPEIPVAFYEAPISLPSGWCDTGGSFLLLSEAYRQDAKRAHSLGWPTIERLGSHLDIVNHPTAIARDLLELTR